MRSIVLNFHGVGPVSRPMEPGEFNCWLDQGFFEEVLDIAREYSHVGLTVDDGNISDVTNLLPALVKRGLRAAFFVCSGRLTQSSFVNPGQLREMMAEGMLIGSHGVGHLPWRQLSHEQLRGELESSRAILEDVCGGSIVEAACPFGSYDRRVLAALRRAGYRRVHTSDGGFSEDDHWIVPRTTVTRSMSLDDIEKLLAEGPGFLQQISIRAKRLCKEFR